MPSLDEIYSAKRAAQAAAATPELTVEQQRAALKANAIDAAEAQRVYDYQSSISNSLSIATLAANAQDTARYQAQGNAVLTSQPSSQMAAGNAYAAAGDALAADAAALQAQQAEADAKTQEELVAAKAATAAAQAEANRIRAELTRLQSTQSTTVTPPPATTGVVTAADMARLDSIEAMKARFKQYGLESLVAKIKELAISGASETTITLQLQETPEYKTRFAANDARVKKGLQVLSPVEYLTMEDTYRQTLRAYGLTQFDNDAYVKQFIANDVSPTELSNRVVTAVQRVRNADPAIATQLREYYGIGQEDLVAYVLDPEQQFQKIQRQVAASEIGVAAGRQGLKAGVGVAEQLAAQGVTQAEAQKGYATIADILPTADKLSQIYGTTMDTYGQSEAEQEVFNSLASAQRTRQKLTAREVAAFSGAAGTGKASLASQARGQIQNPTWTHRPRVAYKTESRSQSTSPSGY